MYFEFLQERDLEQVVLCHDAASGLRAIIAIHSTALGPALGGCRFYPYEDELAAYWDVVALAEGMTYKAAVAGVDLGGGKAVIIGDPAADKSEALLRAFGRHVDSLGGRYITAEDVGTDCDDMNTIRRETRWVAGVSPALGGAGDPSPVTALGVAHGMRAAAEYRWGDDSLADRHVAVQGVGKVGSALVRALHEAGARVTISDRSVAAVRRCVRDFGCAVADPEEVVALDCDILAPCALGGVFDDVTVDRLRCHVICGSANNQLVSEDVADALRKRDILYAPDFIVNAGGLINVAVEMEGYNRDRALMLVEAIRATTRAVLQRADDEAISTALAARQLAEERIAAISSLSHIRRPLPA